MPGFWMIFVLRFLLVMLFLPFSALDKLLNFHQAIGQANQAVANRWFALGLILCGLGIEVGMSLAILTGIADRLAALILALYCVVTALIWKQFWRRADFRLKGTSQGRDLFWDFLKNLAIAGGLGLLALGPNGSGLGNFMHDPLASSHPYRLVEPGEPS